MSRIIVIEKIFCVLVLGLEGPGLGLGLGLDGPGLGLQILALTTTLLDSTPGIYLVNGINRLSCLVLVILVFLC